MLISLMLQIFYGFFGRTYVPRSATDWYARLRWIISGGRRTRIYIDKTRTPLTRDGLGRQWLIPDRRPDSSRRRFPALICLRRVRSSSLASSDRLYHPCSIAIRPRIRHCLARGGLGDSSHVQHGSPYSRLVVAAAAGEQTGKDCSSSY